MSEVITKAVEGSNVIAPAMHDGELRILDTDLATRLGFDRPRDIRKLIKRYEAELGRMGRCATVARRPESGGHTVTEHYLNEEQALFITAKSETTEATKITIEIVTQFAAFKRGEIAPPETPEQLAMRALTGLQSVVEKQREQLAIVTPKAAALDRISAADGEFGLTETAKMIQVKPKTFFDWLDQNRCRYPNGKSKLAYQERINSGYLKNRANYYTDANGEPQVGNTIKVTAKGLAWFARMVPGAELDPAYAHLAENDAKNGLRNLAKKAGAVPFAKKPEPAS